MTAAASPLGFMRTRPSRVCGLCGSEGETLYSELRDRLYGAPGEWRIKQCPRSSCGLLWLDPQPIEEDMGHAYQTYHTHTPAVPGPTSWARRVYRWVRDGYLSVHHGYPPPRAPFLARIVGRSLYLLPDRREAADHQVLHLRYHPGWRVLDVGCGSGGALRFLRDRGWGVEGVDFDPSAVDAARKTGLRVMQGALEHQGYSPGSFDALTMSHFLEHVHDPVRLLKEGYRVLRPGGMLIVVTPNAASWGLRMFGRAWRGLEPPRHLQVFTPSALRNALERAGFAHTTLRTSIHSRIFMLKESLIVAARDAEARGASLPLRDALTGFWFRLAARPRMMWRPEGGEEIVALATR